MYSCELADEVFKKTPKPITKEQVEQVLAVLPQSFMEGLARDKDVTIQGFGRFKYIGESEKLEFQPADNLLSRGEAEQGPLTRRDDVLKILSEIVGKNITGLTYTGQGVDHLVGACVVAAAVDRLTTTLEKGFAEAQKARQDARERSTPYDDLYFDNGRRLSKALGLMTKVMEEALAATPAPVETSWENEHLKAHL